MSPLLVTALLGVFVSLAPLPSSAVTLQSIVDAYGLDGATYDFTWPDSALNSVEANAFIDKNWALNSNKVDWGSSNIVFSADPDTTSATLVRRASSTTKSKTSTATATATSYPAVTDLAGEAPALRIGYPAGSYSKKTGGTQFYAQPLNTTSATVDSSKVGNASSDGQYERMLLSYDIWFPTGWSWNMGGKLPGLRGGSDPHGCSGGSETDGTTCFSTRLMWRSGGSGEVYAYIPTTQKNFCSESGVTCNSDYGTSLSRGAYSFAKGQWQTLYMMVILNEVGTANGVVKLWYNGVPAISFENLVLRTSDNIASVGGLYFSTFFGGDDESWASPTDQYTYFRNIKLYGGAGASNGTGAAAASGAGRAAGMGGGFWGVGAGVVLGLVGVVAGMSL
ncbi:hypothetical protein IAT38_003965 [Cryptococcus sp. DSM 104549]